jgi:hypothetical protein
MRLKQLRITRFFLACVLLVGLVSALTVETANAQSADYLASVNPTENTIYSNVGKLVKFSFQAVWSYGDNGGQAIENAIMAVEVKTADGAVTDMKVENTTSECVAYFNYSSSKPQILTFTPIILITSDETELNSSRIKNDETTLYGLQSEPLTLYWDTFDVALVSSSTETLEAVQLSVNVTYLLVPEEGVTIYWSNNSQEFFPKIAHDVNVTVNGVQAEETAVAGIYNTNVPMLMPEAYVLVEVWQEGWATAHKAFSFPHNANVTRWEPLAVIFACVYAVVLLAVLFLFRKTKRVLSKRGCLPVFAGFLLMLSSFIGLYWVLVWFESASHGFGWTPYWVLGIFSFVFGLLGGIMAVRRQKQKAVLFATSVSIFTTVIAVKASLDAYQLATPWTLLLATLAFSATSGLLIANSDAQFQS